MAGTSRLRDVRAFLGAVLRPERLAVAPAPPPSGPRRRVLRALLAREPLPRDPPLPPRPRSRWLAWLFAVEPLDPP